MKIKAKQEMSRRSFLKLGLASILAIVLLLAAGCVGVGDFNDGGNRRRRRRRR